jgi:hypothetical protein
LVRTSTAMPDHLVPALWARPTAWAMAPASACSLSNERTVGTGPSPRVGAMRAVGRTAAANRSTWGVER